MPEVSIFNSVSNTTNPINQDIFVYLENTRDGKWEDLVHQCRIIEDKEKRDEFKRTMPTTTLSGTFNNRSEAGLVEHSGYIAMDLDEVDDVNILKGKLEKDKLVFSVFVSTSGNGLRVLFKVDPKRHRDAFRGISSYLWDKYRVPSDPNGISLSKPYVVSFDPFLYINPDDAVIFRGYIKEPPQKKIINFVHTTGDFDSIMSKILATKINICDDYNDWLKIGFAISSQFGEDGRSYFHKISEISQKYRFEDVEKQYSRCIKANGSSKVNISSFYYMAREAGVSIVSEQTKTIIRTTKSGKKAGLNKVQIVENLQKFSNIQGVDSVVENVFENSNQDEEDDDRSILLELEMFISTNYSLRMNEVTGYLENHGRQLSPSDLNTIFVSAKKLMQKLDYNLMMRLLKSDFIETYNPFFEFFKSDGVPIILPAIPSREQPFTFSPLIDLLAETIVNDNPAYTNFFLKKWIVSIVSAAHKVHSPLLFALLGPQGTGKTEWFRRLLPKELQHYYAESKLDREKDDELLMTENILIVDDELGGKSKQDAQKLNNITSKQWYSLRRPYGDHNEKILRLAVLCGTSNFNEILNDPSGNRRIIPIDVKDINKELFNSIDKRELFMEAFGLYKNGFDWRVTQNDVPYLNEDSTKYETSVKERELIQKFFEPEDNVRLSTTEVLIEIERLTMQKLGMVSIGREMEKLGFIRKTTRDGMKTIKKWGVKRIGRFEGMGGMSGQEAPF